MKTDKNTFIKDFLKKNWWALWSVLLILIIVNVMIYLNFKDTTTEIKEELQKMSHSVVMLSPTGNIIPQKKTIITEDSPAFQNALKKILVNHLVVSGSELTAGFTRIPNSIVDLVNMYPPFEEFLKNYLTKNGIIAFKQYLITLLRLIKQDKYPDFINILNTKITSFYLTKKGFNITITVNTMMSYDLPEENKKGVKAKGTIVINAEGFFDPSKGNVNNPLGVMFDSFRITIPTKGGNDI